jgi:hypothetical protein
MRAPDAGGAASRLCAGAPRKNGLDAMDPAHAKTTATAHTRRPAECPNTFWNIPPIMSPAASSAIVTETDALRYADSADTAGVQTKCGQTYFPKSERNLT